jgi:hypothetical protein
MLLVTAVGTGVDQTADRPWSATMRRCGQLGSVGCREVGEVGWAREVGWVGEVGSVREFI